MFWCVELHRKRARVHDLTLNEAWNTLKTWQINKFSNKQVLSYELNMQASVKFEQPFHTGTLFTEANPNSANRRPGALFLEISPYFRGRKF